MTFDPPTTGTDMERTLSTAPIAARPTNALAATDQQRAIAEVQAALFIARTNPRDPIRAIDLIGQDCTRPGLAEKALFSYQRGGTDVTGPSIRLAECIAQRWGNMQFGIRELEQRPGESVVQAYAWDVESNTRREVTFTVPHIRDTRKGRVKLEDARDIYEITANMGARRLRACILAIIPGDVVDAAVEQVEATLRTKAEVTPERVQRMLETFAQYEVSREQIEELIQRHLDALTPALLLRLGKIANSLRDGMSAPGDWFKVIEKPATNGAPPEAQTRTESVKAKLRGKAKPSEPAPAEVPPASDMFGGREPGQEG